MKSILLIYVLMVMTSLTVNAEDCMSPAQVRASYNGCMSFLKFSPAKQAAIAAKSGYSYRQVYDACTLQRRKGLASMQANERVYCRSLREGSSSGEGNGSPYTPASPLCSGSMDCHGGYCGAANVCSNGGTSSPCDNSGQCANGYCSAGGSCN